MPTDDFDIREQLEALVRDSKVPASARMRALEVLDRRSPQAVEPEHDADDPQVIADKLLPLPSGAGSGAPDPMRDLDFQNLVGREPHPVFMAFMRWVPPTATRRRLLEAEKLVVRAAMIAGVDGADVPLMPPGPAPRTPARVEPEADELTLARIARAQRAEGTR